MTIGTKLKSARVCGAVVLLPLAGARTAHAQAPAGLMARSPASSGSTEVAKEGFQAVTLRVAPEEAKDTTTLKLMFGGFVSQGNSRTVAATGAADYFVRRGPSALSLVGAANYGRSAPGADEPYATTVENYQARLRYDYFFATRVAGFFSVSARRDRFQGLDLRLNLDPGFAYYFIDEKNERLWAELGYDLQYDLRNRAFIRSAVAAAAPDLLEIERSEVRHGVRAFVGYDNQLTDALKFSVGLEYLQNVTEAKNARVNLDTALTAQVGQRFSIATTVSVKYDNNPLPGVEDTDLIMALNLVYTLD
jgi:putative salt-induced outer membrane protein